VGTREEKCLEYLSDITRRNIQDMTEPTCQPASQPIAKIGWVADFNDGARKEAFYAAVCCGAVVLWYCGVSIDCPAKEEIISAGFNDPERGK